MNIRIDFQVGFTYKGAKGDYAITNIFEGPEEKMISFKVNGGAEQTLKFRTLYHRIRNYMSHNDMTYQGPTTPSNVVTQPEPIQPILAVEPVAQNTQEVENLQQQLATSQDIIATQREYINNLNNRFNEQSQMFNQLMENNRLMMASLEQQAQTITALQTQINDLSGVIGNLTRGLSSANGAQVGPVTYNVFNEYCEYEMNTLDEVATMLNVEVEAVEQAINSNGQFEASGFTVRIA
jgi:predicted RNase H-like nuclease (RuvC/YqgF family)